MALAVTIASFKGIAQVAGRLWEIIWGQRIPPVGLGRLAIGLLPLAFIVLLAGGADWLTAATFTVIFGISNGLVTVVRGAVPLAFASGAGAEARHQIGWVIVGGMSFGTVFTLFVVPVVYLLLAGRRPSDEAKPPARPPI